MLTAQANGVGDIGDATNRLALLRALSTISIPSAAPSIGQCTGTALKRVPFGRD
jgi:hypothetical protein